jgi:hypothetical protein
MENMDKPDTTGIATPRHYVATICRCRGKIAWFEDMGWMHYGAGTGPTLACSWWVVA